MTKKKKATIISLSVIGGVLLTCAGLAFPIFLIFGPTPPAVRRGIYNDCANDENYETICGTATLYVLEKYDYAYVEIYPDDGQYGAGYVYRYMIDSVNNDYLKTNGFYESLTEFETNNGWRKIYTLPGTVTLIGIGYAYGDGVEHNLVSIDVDGTTYLDYETGKANLLYYVQNVMY